MSETVNRNVNARETTVKRGNGGKRGREEGGQNKRKLRASEGDGLGQQNHQDDQGLIMSEEE